MKGQCGIRNREGCLRGDRERGAGRLIKDGITKNNLIIAKNDNIFPRNDYIMCFLMISPMLFYYD